MMVNEKIAIDHGLKKEEYKKICDLLKRIPNITELGIFSAMWNEHCSYKSSKLHLKKLPTKGKKVISLRYKNKTRHRVKTGHRQKLTNVTIQSISVKKSRSKSNGS